MFRTAISFFRNSNVWWGGGRERENLKKKKKEERNRQETWRFSTVEIVYRLLEEVLPFLLGRWCGQRCLTAPHAVAVVTCREKKESLELIVKIDITFGHYIYIFVHR